MFHTLTSVVGDADWLAGFGNAFDLFDRQRRPVERDHVFTVSPVVVGLFVLLNGVKMEYC
jgi:hypothetical protein